MKFLLILGTLLISIGTNLFFTQVYFNYQKDFKKILERTKNPNDILSFDKLYQRFSKELTMSEAEVLALLIGYTSQPEYKPYENLLHQRHIYDLNVSGNYVEALELGKEFIKNHPLNMRGNLEVAYSFQKLNELDSSEFYATKTKIIQNAMRSTGNGKTENTAMFSLSTADSKDFILTYIGAEIGTIGSSSDDNGNFIDVIQAKMKNGQKEYYYFNIQHASKTIFGGKSLEKNIKKSK